jgi:hypothetical protein
MLIYWLGITAFFSLNIGLGLMKLTAGQLYRPAIRYPALLGILALPFLALSGHFPLQIIGLCIAASLFGIMGGAIHTAQQVTKAADTVKKTK